MRLLRLIMMSIAIAFASPSRAIAPLDDQAAGVTISVIGTNAGTQLALVMIELGRLAQNSEFHALLARPREPTAAEAACMAGARSDPSGRIFDLARCAHVWPAHGSAPEDKTFQTEFGTAAGTSGMVVFPAVTVTPFVLEQRYVAAVFPAKIYGERFTGAGLTLQPTQAFVDRLCNPKFTLVPRESCKVRVVSHFLYQPDIYVSEIGYHVDLNVRPSLADAIRLRTRILKDLSSLPGISKASPAIVVGPATSASPEQAGPSDDAGSSSIARLWGNLGAKADDVDLAASGASPPPDIFLFDPTTSIEDGQPPMRLGAWLKRLGGVAAQRGASTCQSGPGATGHSDGVAGLLFPKQVASKTDTAPVPAGIPPLGTWNGFVMSDIDFGSSRTGVGFWFQRGGLAKAGEPVIALLPFSMAYADNSGLAETLAERALGDPTNILVVSAPQSDKVGAVGQFWGKSSPTFDPELVAHLCLNGAWPACLGVHPRVLVVAPSSTSHTGDVSLFSTADYLLGASHVRLAAPGDDVPIFAPCAPAADGTEKWVEAPQSGSSYAAPLVALVIARLIQVGPPELRQLPEAAIWRVLATTDPLSMPVGTSAAVLTQYGELNAGRALTGASISDVGADGFSSVVEAAADGKPHSSLAVIMPFLWNDQRENLSQADDTFGIQGFGRGLLSYEVLADDGTVSKSKTIPFSHAVRLVRRPAEIARGAPLFDLYYVANDDAPYLAIDRRVRLGFAEDVVSQGYCRNDGNVLQGIGAGATPKTQSSPACLYAWRAGTTSFVPLDMGEVLDVVFPPNHFDEQFPGGISPTDVTALVSPGSPWRSAFCATRPRLRVEKMLLEMHQPGSEAACGAVGS